MSVTVCLDGLGTSPYISLCGTYYHTRSGTFKYKPRAKSVTEKRSLTNERRRQISWDPREWEFTIPLCTLAQRLSLEVLYYGETYASYTCDFYDGYYGVYPVTFDTLEFDLVGDNTERWDAKVHLTEWI